MKKLLPFSVILFLTATILSSCEDQEDRGRNAGKDFCDCYKTKSVDQCNDEFHDDYGSQNISDDFKKGFDAEAKKCGIVLQITTSK